GRRGSARFVLLGEPFHGTDRPYGFGRLRFVPLLELLRALAHVLVVALARKRLLVPVQELRGRTNLVVVLAFRKHRHLVEVFGEPRRRLRNVDKAVLDYSGLRIKTHDLVGGRLVVRPRDDRQGRSQRPQGQPPHPPPPAPPQAPGPLSLIVTTDDLCGRTAPASSSRPT